MNFPDFQRYMREVGCNDRAIGYVYRLVGSLVHLYPWIDSDELLTLSLEMVPRALDTYNPTRGASFATHLTTVARNACKSYIRKLVLYRMREKQFFVDGGSFVNTTDPVSAATYSDEVDTLFQVLSPFAQQLFVLTLRTAPRRFSMKQARRYLQVSASSASHLFNEIRYSASMILEGVCPGER